MNFIENIKLKLEDRRIRKMENLLVKIHRRNNLAFNPLQVGMTVDLIGDKPFSARLLENYVWYSASIPLLRSFYYKSTQFRQIFGSDDDNFFWRKSDIKSRKVHSKIPAIISDRMVDLVISSGITFNCEVFNESGEVSDDESKKVQEVLDEIYKENDIYSLLNEAVSDASWSGGVCGKILIDSDVSKLPIIVFEDQRNFELITRHKRINAIIFKYWYEKNIGNKDEKIKYLMHETYTTNENGKAVIVHELFKIQSDKQIKVPLTEIEETQDLKDIEVFESIDGMLALFIPNRRPNKEFKGIPYGESDYAGCYSLFDSIDELLSTMMEELRDGKIKTFIPESLLPKDKSGNIIDPDGFHNKYIKIEDKDKSEDNNITTSAPQLRINDYIAQWKSMITLLLNTVGLSPLTIGITGLEAISASETSQREREKVSLRTRKSKIKIWEEALAKLSIMCLQTYREMTSRAITYPGLERIDVDNRNLNIKVNFGDYISMPFEERLTVYGAAKVNGTMSTEEAVEQIYRDEKTEEQKQTEVNRLKMEQGMSLSNTDNLLL